MRLLYLTIITGILTTLIGVSSCGPVIPKPVDVPLESRGFTRESFYENGGQRTISPDLLISHVDLFVSGSESLQLKGADFEYLVIDDSGLILYPSNSTQRLLIDILTESNRNPVAVDISIDGALLARAWVVDPIPDSDTGPFIAYQEVDAIGLYSELVDCFE